MLILNLIKMDDNIIYMCSLFQINEQSYNQNFICQEEESVCFQAEVIYYYVPWKKSAEICVVSAGWPNLL